MQKRAKSSLVYTLAVEDMVAFNLFHMRHSPAVRKTQREFIIKYSLLMFALAFLMMLIMHKPPLFAFSVGLFIVFWVAAYLVYYQRHGYIARVRKKLQALDAESKNSGLFGVHTLDIDDKGIADRTDVGVSRIKWQNLVQIENEPGYTYLYLSAVNALIIPHNAITSGDIKAVLEQIGRYYHPEKPLAPQ